jgi:hypothetical protein
MMPREVIRLAKTIEDVMDRCGVTYTAATQRIKTLGNSEL